MSATRASDRINAPRTLRWRYIPVAVIAVFGIVFSLASSRQVSEWENQRVETAFQEAARDRVLIIQREIEYTFSIVEDVAGLFEVSRNIARREFRKFVSPVILRHQGVKALEWIPVVPASELLSFLAKARVSFPNFQITDEGADSDAPADESRTLRLPILYVQPYQQNKAALGFDLASDPQLLDSLLEASRSGNPLVRTLQHQVRGYGSNTELTIYIPVYRRSEGAEPGDPEGDEQTPGRELIGFAAGMFRLGGVIERALESLSPSGIDIHFFRGTDAGNSDLLYFHHSRKAVAGGPSAGANEEQGNEMALELQVGDQKWRVICSAHRQYFHPDLWNAWLVLVGGLAFTSLLTAYLLTLVNQAEKIQRLVNARTGQLVTAIQALKRQIVDRQRAEEKLQRLNETLEQRVTTRTEESRRRTEELEQFAYVASHDLKAPLRAIANLSAWLEEDLQTKLDPETREQLRLMRDRVQRMQNLIDGLLEYSRVGRVPTASQEVDTGKLLKEVVDLLSPQPGFKVKLAPDMPTLRTDSLRLGQVFSNLIGNALKHHGGDRGKIRVSARPLGSRYEFSVCDDGQGIDPAYHSKVFMMFQTLQSRDHGSDTGIGLALVKKIVQEHGGWIRLESEEGKGACFHFTWPRDSNDVTAESIRR